MGIAFLAGLIIFPFVFSSGIETQGGPGLIFQVFPKIFEGLGPLTGTVIASLDNFCKIGGTNVIASGGISNLDDIKNVKKCNPYGVILGKALYEDLISIEEAKII